MGAKQLGIAVLLVAAMAPAVRSQPILAAPIIARPLQPAGPRPLDNSGNPPFDPAQIQQAYGVNSLAAYGAGQTIAIVDAYNYPNALSALNTFSSDPLGSSYPTYSLPQFNVPGGPTFTQLNQSGSTSLPGTDPAGAGASINWEYEEALDIEYAHALAPYANIILYEANSDSSTDLYAAVTAAKKNSAVSVISMSWGGGEYSGETSFDSVFTTPSSRLAAKQGVTFVASAGDTGGQVNYPAASPNVVAVGGTSLALNGNNSYSGESAWNSGGGGTSSVQSKPSYQTSYGTLNGGLLASTTTRATPDVAFVADPNTGVMDYDPYNGGFFQIGGTSLSAPCWAGLIADANGLRVANGHGTLDGPSQTLPALYSLPNTDFHEVTSGNNGVYSAGPGYNLCTGLGTPVANSLVPDLAGYGVAPVQGIWIRPGSGSWSTRSNWTGNSVPGATDKDTANFGNAIGSSSATVTIDIPVVVCAITFSNTAGGSYTLSGSNTLTLNNSGSGATIAVVNGSHVINAPVDRADNLGVTGSGTLAIGGSIADNGNQLSLTMSGSNGTLILSGSNTYGGGTFLNAGTLLVGADNQLGAAPASPAANLTFNGGKLSFSAPMTLNANRSIQLNSGGGTLDTQGNNIIYGGSISGSGGPTKTGPGTLTVLPYTSTSLNATTIAQGTLRFQVAANPPAFQNASFASPAIADNSYTYSLPAGLIWSGGGNAPVLINNSTAWGYSIPYPGGDQAISLQETGAISQTLNFTSPGTYVLTFYSEERGGQTNPGAIYLDGGTAAVATWTAPSGAAWTQFSENITIATAGTHGITFAGTTGGSDQSCAIDDIGLSANPTLLSFSSVNLTDASSVLDVSGATTTIGALSGVAGSEVLIPGGTLTIDGPGGTTFSGSIVGAGGSLTMDGSGTLVLSGSNTYSGGTVVGAGTLLLASDTAIADGSSLTVGDAAAFAGAADAAAASPAGVVAIPEPGTLVLLGVAAGGLLAAFAARRRKSV
jgi:autotransporter-associated beta strand protein